MFSSCVVAFVVGAAVLVSELGIVRLAAPYVGASQPVWAIVIAAVLTGLACGNWLGGRLADRGRQTVVAYALLLGGSLVAVLPVGGTYVLGFAVGPHGVVLALLVLAFLSGLPAVVLGVVTPVLIRLEASSLDRVGTAAGRIQAWATLGSLVGALGTTFVFVPAIGVRHTFLATGLVLVFVAACVRHRWWWLALVAAGGCCLAHAGSVSPAVHGQRVAVDTAYATWTVHDTDDGLRILLSDDGITVQSYRDLTGADRQYGSWPLLALGPSFAAWANGAPRMFVVGLAGGNVATAALRAYPDLQIDAVELDGGVVELAREWFQLPHERLHVQVADGRSVLVASSHTYDAIVIDAFRSAYVPPHLVTREFFAQCGRKLRAGGVVMINAIGRGREPGEEGALVRAVVATLQTVFRHAYVLELPNGLNTVVVASARAIQIDQTRSRLEQVSRRHPPLAAYGRKLVASWEPQWGRVDARVLTDDCSPVEWLTHRLALARVRGGLALRPGAGTEATDGN